MTVEIETAAPPIALAEAKAWLRLGGAQEDAVVAGLIRSAAELCEAFIGQMLITRGVGEELPLAGGWMRLSKRPVVAIETVIGLGAAGEVVLDEGDWSQGIDRDGAARLRVDAPEGATRLRIVYRAGLASDADGVPEAIRHGLSRMIQHLYAARDGEAAEFPAIIAALWQPWRHVALGVEIVR